jgi:putative ABC transport system substrate-binding protein
VEGKDIVIEYRYADGKLDRLSELAAELVRLKVDVIVTGGSAATRSAKAATHTIPIVMAQDGDPVGNRFITSLSRPGGNITGLSTLSPDLTTKRLELLKEIAPRLYRVAVFETSTQPDNVQQRREAELAAGALGLKLHYLDVLGAKDIDNAFRSATKERVEAVLMLVSGRIASLYRKEIAELSVKSRLPVMYERATYVEAGGLMSYDVNLSDLDSRAAVYVDKILKGSKPGDLPVEQATKFDLVINLKAAKQIGLTIPAHVLARADRVVR